MIGLAMYAIGAFLFVPAGRHARLVAFSDGALHHRLRRGLPGNQRPIPTSPLWAIPETAVRCGSTSPRPLTVSPRCWGRWSAAM